MKYTTVMADPPWPYATPGKGPLAAGTPSNPEAWKGNLTGSNMRTRYPPLAMDKIKSMPVADFVDANAHLYLWTTNGFICEAHDVARAWGFRPITLITWTKVMKDDPETASMKTGYYFRGATEHVVFAVRGSLKLTSTRGVSTAFLHPRTPHSVKPDAFYSLIEECSPGPYLELFARRTRPGWSVWGNQVESDIALKVG
jgi:N6-adenosine-specific RNA methylase IME4